MKLHLDWSHPIPLKDGTEQNLIYAIDEHKLPDAAGVYIFGRQWGKKKFEALYVGKADNIHHRIVRQQLKNLPLMLGLRNAKTGARIALAGRFVSRPGQQAKRCLPVIERALIRYFLSEGHELVNKQGTRLRHHEIASDGKHPKRFFPRLMYLERARGL
ncbi:MAG TPA: hypothetical protein VJN41_07525 [Alphaproteobacteria bacterium]|nr:hypothetical protein [Alphaproteobacteria bacterium]